MWVGPIAHDSDYPGHVIPRVGQDDPGPSVYKHVSAHHDVLLLRLQHGLRGLPRPNVIQHVHHGLLAREQARRVRESRELLIQRSPLLYQLESQAYTREPAADQLGRVLQEHVVQGPLGLGLLVRVVHGQEVADGVIVVGDQ